ncbi:MAG TPA: hypothetical protein VFP80_03280 [Thermoanaerobaculia bacterium]|nr:hypothetical protein [Thermoanaerobaculia bacterium]
MLLDLFGRAAPGATTPQAAAVPPGRADSACPAQWDYMSSAARFNTVACSRRAGKTTAAWLRALRSLSRPGTWTHYVSLLRRNARTQFFLPLLRWIEARGWPHKANLSDLIIETPWGSYLKAFSVTDMGSVGSVKGDRSDLFMLDECQEPADDVIEALIDVAATPMTIDTGGAIDLLGTVPEVEPCFFSRALDSDQWAHFAWTMFDHDLPRPAAEKRADVEQVVRTRGLTWEHPIVQREYLGRRVRDPGKFVYEFDWARNTFGRDELSELVAAETRRVA